VTDVTAPVIVECPANINLSAGANCTAIATWSAPTVTDNCTGPVIAQTAGPVSGSAFPLGVTTVTYTATDGSGNTSTCSFTVTVSDVTAPVIVDCPADINLSAGASCTSIATWSAPTVTDNCSGASIAQTAGPVSGSAFPLGITTVTYIAIDGSGNSSTCSFTVTVSDMTAPVISSGSIASCYTSVLDAEAAALAATSATDNCSGNVSFSASTSGTCDAEVTVTATDVHGNSATIIYDTRIDNVAPVVTTIAGSLDGSFLCTHTGEINAALALVPSATDDCVSPVTLNLLSDVTVGPYCDQVRTRIWNFTDECGNTSATFTQTITLLPVVQVHPRVLLDGAYVEATDRMNDGLRAANIIPAAQPYANAPFSYAGTETVSPSVLAVSDPDDAIVDWVLVELRDNTTPTTIIARRAVRTCNRKPALAAKYEAVHGALARGRK